MANDDNISYDRFREDQKRRIEGAAHKPGGKRDWAQVLCNGGIATELALLYLIDVGSAGVTLTGFGTRVCCLSRYE